MTAAERLQLLAGTTGTAAALLLMIGAGATAGEALVDYAGASGDAATLLLADRILPPEPVPGFGSPWRPLVPHRPKEEDEALLLAVLH